MQQPLPFSPNASLDIAWDWSAWLGTDTLASVTVTPPAGVTVSGQTQVGGVITVWASLSLKLGTGTLLPVVCKVTTSSTPPRVDARIIVLQVTAR